MENRNSNEKHQPRRSSFSNDPPLAIEVDLEKEWDKKLERNASESVSSILEPEKARTRTNEEDDDDEEASSHRDLEGSPVVRTVTAQDWTGPDDPEVSCSTIRNTSLRLTVPQNPHNWSLRKRIYHTIPPGLFGFIVTFGSSVYTPANEEIAKHFNVTPTVALLGVTLYVIGLGFGPMLSAPASETFGRLIVYRVSLPISLLFTLGAGFSKTFYSLLICRFFAGFAGSPVLAVGAGTNADLFPPKYRAIATSSFLLAPFLGPSLGPFLGGWVAQYKGWRWTQWISLFIGVGVYIISLPMKETYKKVKALFPPSRASSDLVTL